MTGPLSARDALASGTAMRDLFGRARGTTKSAIIDYATRYVRRVISIDYPSLFAFVSRFVFVVVRLAHVQVRELRVGHRPGRLRQKALRGCGFGKRDDVANGLGAR